MNLMMLLHCITLNHDDGDIKQLVVQLQQSFNEQKADLQSSINGKIEGEIKSLQSYIDQQVGQLTTRINDVEERVVALERMEEERTKFNYDDTLVAINLPFEANENITAKANDLINRGLRVHGVPVVRAMRLKGRNGKPGITKIQLVSLDDKKKLLNAKSNLKQSDSYRNVFIRSSKSHEERLAETNFRAILNVIPGGSNLMLTSNGKIVSKTFNSTTPSNNPPNRRQHSDYTHMSGPWISPSQAAAGYGPPGPRNFRNDFYTSVMH